MSQTRALPCKRCGTDEHMRWLWQNEDAWQGDVQDMSPNAILALNCRQCGHSGQLRATRREAGEAWNAANAKEPNA